jgi:SAM-dependent methyltransferase
MKSSPEFVNPVLTPWNLDVYHTRHSIWRSIQDVLPQLEGTLLDVGSGQSPYREMLTAPPSKVESYLGMDFADNHYAAYAHDLTWDGKTIPLSEAAVNCTIATEVLEHCPDPGQVLREIGRVLKPGGLVFLTVPFLWPLHDVPYDEYRYTPFSLERHLREAGFEQIRILAHGGWDASLAQMLGLWATRRQMSLTWRRVIGRVILAINRRLLKADKVPGQFDQSVMVTGFSATARKATR